MIGVLGGIASGKSLAARLLAGEDGVVVDADRIAREVLESAEVVAELERAFGRGVLDAQRSPDREALARVVFADPGARARLEALTHPRVRARILASLERARGSGTARIVLDVPLLLETDEALPSEGSPPSPAVLPSPLRQCDVLVFVDADDSERDRRAQERRGWEPGEVARREAAQLPLEEKKKRADYVLRNDRGPDELAAAVREVLRDLAARGRDD